MDLDAGDDLVHILLHLGDLEETEHQVHDLDHIYAAKKFLMKESMVFFLEPAPVVGIIDGEDPVQFGLRRVKTWGVLVD